MRKILILSLAVFGFFISQAQVNPNAIGLRFNSNGIINGAEISYQKGIGDINRIELDLGLGMSSNYTAFTLAGMYHWDWNITDGLNWFTGPGAAVGLYSYDKDSYINAGIGGQIGLEYDFNHLKAPLLLSLDFRPMWIFGNGGSGFGWGIALGIRYTF